MNISEKYSDKNVGHLKGIVSQINGKMTELCKAIEDIGLEDNIILSLVGSSNHRLEDGRLALPRKQQYLELNITDTI